MEISQGYKVKVIYKIEEKEHGYDGEKSVTPLSVDSKTYKAPEGMGYDDATTVIAHLFHEAELLSEGIKATMKQFENLIAQYHFEEIDEKDALIANLCVFANKDFKLFQKFSVKHNMKKHCNGDFKWIKKEASTKEINNIYDEAGAKAPRIINLIGD